MRFDPTKAVTFDLDSGLVHLDGAPARVLVPADALAALCAAAGPDAAAAFGRTLGAAMGRRIATRFAAAAPGGAAPAAAGLRAASTEAVVEHLGGELALGGLGALGVERWGRALVLVLDRCPLGAEGDSMIAALLEAALAEAAGSAARVLPLDRESVRARYLVSSGAAVERVRAWLSEGLPWGEALVRLHTPRGAA